MTSDRETPPAGAAEHPPQTRRVYVSRGEPCICGHAHHDDDQVEVPVETADQWDERIWRQAL